MKTKKCKHCKEEIAKVNNTSFNNVIISMIEFCLLEEDEKDNNKK